MIKSRRVQRLSLAAQLVRIGAQQYLEKFYGELGFARASEPYDEDGIMHIEMLRKTNG